MTRMRSIFQLILAAALTLPAVPEADTFEAALAAASKNAETSEGKVYDSAVGRAFGEKHGATMVRCTNGATESELGAFDLVMLIGASGIVEEAMVRPETSVARCLRDDVGDDQYPKPPSAGYWVHVRMSISE